MHPQDIEDQVLDPRFGLRPGRVVAFQAECEGPVIRMAGELRKPCSGPQDYEKLARDMRASIAIGTGLSVGRIVFVGSGELPKTTSGKIRRARTRELAARGALTGVLHSSEVQLGQAPGQNFRDHSKERTTAQRLQAIVLDVSRVHVDPRRTLLDQVQLDSIRVAELLALVQSRLQVDLPANILADVTTLQELADRIDLLGPSSVGRPRSIVTLSLPAASTVTPAYLVHPVQGDVGAFIPLSQHWQGPLYGFRRTRDFATLGEMSEAYLEDLRDVADLSRPFVLGGYSMGAVVAREMAARCETEGLMLEGLLLIEPPSPRGMDFGEAVNALFGDYLIGDELQALHDQLGDFDALDRADAVLTDLGVDPALVKNIVGALDGWTSNAQLLLRHDGDSPVIRTRTGLFQVDGADYPAEGLLDVHRERVGGDHFTVLDPGRTKGLVRRIAEWLGPSLARHPVPAQEEDRVAHLSEALRGHPMLRDFEEVELAMLLWNVRQLDFADGERLLHEGDDGASLLLLTSGQVEIRRSGRPVLSLGEGEMVGELAFIDPSPRSADVVALGAVQAFELRREDLMQKLAAGDAAARFWMRLAGLLCDRLEEVTVRVESSSGLVDWLSERVGGWRLGSVR